MESGQARSWRLDGRTIQQVEEKLDDELYKIWNRMSSGSYQAQAVKLITIPKVKGGVRMLGIPNVTDRVAQTIIKNRLNAKVDQIFHPNSYAYREGKSAIDAVATTRERCIRKEWVVEIDIKGFFDNLDHDLILEIVEKYEDDKLVRIYCKKFLKAEGVMEDGEKLQRDKGTPQGGVVSPVLANLYLHEVFDKWMSENHPNIMFERYADDIIIHTSSEKQAFFIKDKVEERLEKYKLEMHSEKSKVVYAGTKNDYDDRGHKLSRKFTFLGYEFKPRSFKGKLVFTPGIGKSALVMINSKIKRMRLNSRVQEHIEEIACDLNKKVRGWINYYGHFRRSELYKLAGILNERIAKFLKKKHKLRAYGKSWKALKALKSANPKLFVHWHMIAENPSRAV